MSKRYAAIILSLIMCAILVAAGGMTLQERKKTSSLSTETPHTPSDTAQIRLLVERFGHRLSQVSLLSPDASEEIEREYGIFVTPSLLAEWKEEPAHALGRLTSSPWPDRIEVTDIKPDEGGTFLVHGSIVDVTNEGGGIGEAPTEAIRRPLVLSVTKTAQGPRIAHITMTPYPGDADWTYTTPDARGFQFLYPVSLPTLYITLPQEGWPPVVSMENTPLSCANQDIRPVGDRALCRTATSGGAAGTTYTTYTYSIEQGGSVVRATFTLGFPQCMNYDEPTQDICKEDQATFDIDGMADRILSSVRKE